MKCSSGKSSYDNREIALEALIQNHIRFTHNPGKGPINIYECDVCGQWHFTSRTPMAEELQDPDTQLRIRREKKALEWEQKLR